MARTKTTFTKGDGRIRKKKGDIGKVKREALNIFQQMVDYASAIDQIYKKPHAIVWLEAVAAKDPGRALESVAKVAEYVMPKQARIEHTGKDGDEMVIKFIQGAKPNT